jgi:hypothetical protein
VFWAKLIDVVSNPIKHIIIFRFIVISKLQLTLIISEAWT